MVICWDEGLSSQSCPRGIAREILLILLYCNGLLFAPIFFLICVRFCVLHSVTSAHEAVGKDDECKSQPNFRYWRYAINTLDGNHQDKWKVLSLCRAPPQRWSVGFVPLLTCFLGHFLLQEALCSRHDLLTASSKPAGWWRKNPIPSFSPHWAITHLPSYRVLQFFSGNWRSGELYLRSIWFWGELSFLGALQDASRSLHHCVGCLSSSPHVPDGSVHRAAGWCQWDVKL